MTTAEIEDALYIFNTHVRKSRAAEAFAIAQHHILPAAEEQALYAPLVIDGLLACMGTLAIIDAMKTFDILRALVIVAGEDVVLRDRIEETSFRVLPFLAEQNSHVSGTALPAADDALFDLLVEGMPQDKKSRDVFKARAYTALEKLEAGSCAPAFARHAEKLLHTAQTQTERNQMRAGVIGAFARAHGADPVKTAARIASLRDGEKDIAVAADFAKRFPKM